MHSRWHVGGGCPPDWEIGEAEAYAILRYLLRVIERAPEPGAERILICSDSQGTLDKIEAAWRAGDMRDYGAGASAGLIEAICTARAQLGRVIMVYCPAHSGIAGNEMADAVAKAHLNSPHRRTRRR